MALLSTKADAAEPSVFLESVENPVSSLESISPDHISAQEGDASYFVDLTIPAALWEPAASIEESIRVCSIGEYQRDVILEARDGSASWGSDLSVDTTPLPGLPGRLLHLCINSPQLITYDNIIKIQVVDDELDEGVSPEIANLYVCTYPLYAGSSLPPLPPLPWPDDPCGYSDYVNDMLQISITDNDLPVPVIESFFADPESIVAGGSTTISWNASDADDCTAADGGGGWAGSDISLPSGSLEITLEDAGSYTFTLNCINEFGPTLAQTDVDVSSKFADLETTQVTTGILEIEHGESFDATATVVNNGLASSGISTVTFVFSRDILATPFDPKIGSAPMPSLDAGEQADVPAQVVASVEPGSWYLGACVREVAGEPETNDNCDKGPRITVIEATGPACDSQVLTCGQQLQSDLGASQCASGPLGQDHYAELYTFDGQAGDELLVAADWAFDGYLLMEDPNGLVVAENDNFTSSGNSFIQFRLPSTDTYRIWASSYVPGQTGPFELSLDCQSPGGPDLAPETPLISNANPVPGAMLSLEVNLLNLGDQASDSTTLRVFLSSDAVIDPGDAQLDSDGAQSLSAGSLTSADFAFPAPATPGPYWLGACADPVSGELVTVNNCSAGRALSVVESPSCGIEALACGDTSMGRLTSEDCTTGPRGAGYYAEPYQIEAESGVPLQVNADWSTFDGYLYLADVGGTVVAENDDLVSIGDSRIEYIPQENGRFQLWATSYGREVAGEFEISLNCGSVSAPDLLASPVRVDSSDVSVGQSIAVDADIFNNGSGEASATTAHFVASNDEFISPKDAILASVDVGALAAGASQTISSLVGAPETPGSYWLGLCVDPVKGESRTGNNCSLVLPDDTARLMSANSPRSGQQSANDSGTLVEVSSGAACDPTVLSCGENPDGNLSASDCDRGPRGAGYLTDAYRLSGTAGTTVSVRVDWSGMDGMLYLTDSDGDVISQNDNYQDPANSRVEVELPVSGDYAVWPTSFDQGAQVTGSYTMSVACNNPDAPDWAVEPPDLGSDTVRNGQSLSIQTTVRNGGNSTAEMSKLRFYLAKSAEPSEKDRPLGDVDLEALGAGGNTRKSTVVPLGVRPGMYYVTACADVDPLELELKNNCASNGPVTVEDDQQPIPINTGLNDAWFNPDTSGQGFFINVFPNTRLMFLSWFTYDTERPPPEVEANLGDAGHRWLTAQGNYELGEATLSVTLSEGGTFDSPAPEVMNTPNYGTMVVRFNDCKTGEIEYDLPSIGDSGTIPISRVTYDNVTDCQERVGEIPDEQRPDSVSGSNPLLNDAWFNPDTAGQGFFFNVFPESGLAFLSWFTYDTERPPADTPHHLDEPGHRWLTAQGPFNGKTANLSVTQTVGGVFNQGTPRPQNSEDGTIVATFENCNKGSVDYNIHSINRSGVVPIERITRDSIPVCDTEGNTSDGSEVLVPADKQVLENACEGQLTWEFDWPDDPQSDTYAFVLLRNDTLTDEDRTWWAGLVSTSEIVYRKVTPVPDEHLEGWRWIYAPYKPTGIEFGKKKGRMSQILAAVEGREPHPFSVRPKSAPCLD
jgi:hypothetical protein